MITEIPKGYCGFVYLIENKSNGKKYIGKKFFHTHQKRNKTRRKTRESNWLTYWGSSDILKNEIENIGKDNFKRTIISFHKTKGDTNYTELKYLWMNNVLERDDFYNDTIGTRRRPREHIKDDRILNEQLKGKIIYDV